MRLRNSLLSLILLVLFSTPLLAYGQGAPPGGGTGGGGSTPVVAKQLVFGDLSYGIVLSGINTDLTPISVENQKLSGTKVEFTVTVGSGYVAAPPGGSPNVTKAAVTDLEIYILGAATADDVLPGQAPVRGVIAGGVGQYRLATTYFQHNADIRVRAKCTFTFTHSGGTTVVPFDDYVQFKAYNLLQSAGTDVDTSGSWNSIIQNVSQSTVGHIQTYGGFMNHGLDPSTVTSAMNQSAAEIIAKTKDSTAMLANLHGSVTLIGDSNLTGSFGHSDIFSKVQAKAADLIPGFNLVVFWSCKTFDLVSGSGWAGAYGVSSPDRAFLGYAVSIYALCWTEEEWLAAELANKHDPYDAGTPFSRNVSHNAEILLDHMSVGATLGEARFYALSQVPMVNRIAFLGDYSFSRTHPLIAGDYGTRLRYVYLTTAERTAISSQSGSVDVSLVKVPIQ